MAWPAGDRTLEYRRRAVVVGTEIERERAFVTALRYLKTRIFLFAGLPLKSLDEMTLRSRLSDIGQAEGSTSKRPDVA